MPPIKVVFYRDDDGSVPVLEWLDELPAKAQTKCLGKIECLALLGHELRRPEADLLRDDIYELRIALSGIQYRILYFFHERVAAVLAHGILKKILLFLRSRSIGPLSAEKNSRSIPSDTLIQMRLNRS